MEHFLAGTLSAILRFIMLSITLLAEVSEPSGTDVRMCMSAVFFMLSYSYTCSPAQARVQFCFTSKALYKFTYIDPQVWL